MSRLGRMLRNRITLALLGVALVGGGSAYWAATTGMPATRQVSSSIDNSGADPTGTGSADDPPATTTTDPGAAATTSPRAPTATPRATSTPCPTPTAIPVGQSVQWRGAVASVGATSFVLRVGCGRPTVSVDSATAWSGQATKLADLHAGWSATVAVTRQTDSTYLASSVTALAPIDH
jgi:hypothetical protein